MHQSQASLMATMNRMIAKSAKREHLREQAETKHLAQTTQKLIDDQLAKQQKNFETMFKSHKADFESIVKAAQHQTTPAAALSSAPAASESMGPAATKAAPPTALVAASAESQLSCKEYQTWLRLSSRMQASSAASPASLAVDTSAVTVPFTSPSTMMLLNPGQVGQVAAAVPPFYFNHHGDPQQMQSSLRMIRFSQIQRDQQSLHHVNQMMANYTAQAHHSAMMLLM
jgi:hypothetical protein